MYEGAKWIISSFINNEVIISSMCLALVD